MDWVTGAGNKFKREKGRTISVRGAQYSLDTYNRINF